MVVLTIVGMYTKTQVLGTMYLGILPATICQDRWSKLELALVEPELLHPSTHPSIIVDIITEQCPWSTRPSSSDNSNPTGICYYELDLVAIS